MMNDDTTTENTDTTEVTAISDETLSVENARKLRSEAKGLRDRAKTAETRAEELARQLFTARVAATGKVENPAEIAYVADILDDTDALDAAIDTAIAERPYIASRRVHGDIGQGVTGEATGPQDFSSLFSRT